MTSEEKFEANPSLFGLKNGGLLGIIDGCLVVLLLMAVLVEARDAYIAAIIAGFGLMTGLFVGGLIGLYAHLKSWSKKRTELTLLLTQPPILLILALAIVLQYGAG